MIRTLFVLMLLGGPFIACKNESVAKKNEDSLQQLEKTFKDLKEGNGEVVEISVLKEALPEKLMGMKRTSHNGQKSAIAGIKIASADARYEDGDRKMSITIMDTGGLGAAVSALAAWSAIEIDNESEDGYERTTMIDGKKAIEKYNRKTQQGEISVISADRFIFSIKSSNLSEDDLRSVVSKIKFKG